jgi:hypothetical protein
LGRSSLHLSQYLSGQVFHSVEDLVFLFDPPLFLSTGRIICESNPAQFPPTHKHETNVDILL